MSRSTKSLCPLPSTSVLYVPDSGSFESSLFRRPARQRRISLFWFLFGFVLQCFVSVFMVRIKVRVIIISISIGDTVGNSGITHVPWIRIVWVVWLKVK